jgi:hypothetical protein
MKTKHKKINFNDEYIRINKEINRNLELERNGGRWIAVNRPHKNKKKYDRKQNKKELSNQIDNSFFVIYLFSI